MRDINQMHYCNNRRRQHNHQYDSVVKIDVLITQLCKYECFNVIRKMNINYDEFCSATSLTHEK